MSFHVVFLSLCHMQALLKYQRAGISLPKLCSDFYKICSPSTIYIFFKPFNITSKSIATNITDQIFTVKWLRRRVSLIRPRFRHHRVRDVRVAVALFTLLSKFSAKDENGIANATSAKIARKRWTRSMLVTVPIRTSTARRATAKTGDRTDTDSLVVQVSCKLMA